MSDSNFSFPYTKMPNSFIDLLKDISGSSTKIYIFLCRKIYGWQKNSDVISHSQIKEKTGLSSRAIIKSIKELENCNLIKTIKTGKGKNQKIEYILPVNEKNSLAKNDTFITNETSNGYFFAPLDQFNGAKKSYTKESINIKKEEEKPILNNNISEKITPIIENKEDSSSLINTLISHELHINQVMTAIKSKSPDFIKEKINILEFMLENHSHKVKGKSIYLYNLIFKDWTSEEYNKFQRDKAKREENELIQKRKIEEQIARENYLNYEKELKSEYEEYIENECNNYFENLPNYDQLQIMENAKKNIKIPFSKENKNSYDTFFRVSFIDLLKSIILDLISFNDFILQKKI